LEDGESVDCGFGGGEGVAEERMGKRLLKRELGVVDREGS